MSGELISLNSESLLNTLKGLGAKERREALRKKHELTVDEAALMLGMERSTLLNRVSQAKRDPSLCPTYYKKGPSKNAPLVFLFPDVEAWDKARTVLYRTG